VLGPLNGGVAWPKAFDAERRREREWLSYVRGVHRWVPGYSATRRAARAILCGSRDVVEQMPMWARDKCFYIPENAVDAARFNTTVDRGPATLPLKVTFVGRLVPYKGTDMLLAAAAPLIREGKVVVDVIGDGPEMESIKKLVDRERIASGVTFSGWIEHTKLQERFSRADVFGFPSVREFGGGVVLEAMMLGLAPVVVDYGGPGELVSPMTGIAVPLGSREEIVARVREALSRLATNPAMAREMGRLGRERALRHFTWSAKAEQVMRVYEWILGRRKAKPEMPMPIPDTTQAPADGGVESKEESGRMVRNT
jgi:glycosyltransferase involved in cell wall biosynthesis